MKKPYNHDGDEMQCKVEEFKMNLKRRIEDSPQPVNRIYIEEIISLYTTSLQITPMFLGMKNLLYKTRNTSYLPVSYLIDDVNINEFIYK